jgi:hypothetical protein
LRLVHLRKSAALVVLVALPAAAACSGGKSQAEKAKDAAAQARAACAVFSHFEAPTGTGSDAQVAYAKAAAAAFGQAADLAKAAAAEDPTWNRLATSSRAEADSFAIIVKASTEGLEVAKRENVLKAVEIARNARPVFIAQCAKVDPKTFTAPPTSSPSPSASPEPKGSKNI